MYSLAGWGETYTPSQDRDKHAPLTGEGRQG